MKIVAVLGSPHLNGNGSETLRALLSGADFEKHEIFQYDLRSLNIGNCLGCRACINNGGTCVQKDDFPEVFKHLMAADTVIIESPIYINQVNGFTKTFLDRCYPLTDARHKPRFGRRNLIMVCTYAAPIPFLFSGYIRRTAHSLKAMGLIPQKTIIIHGCTTLDRVKNDEKLCRKLSMIGARLFP